MLFLVAVLAGCDSPKIEEPQFTRKIEWIGRGEWLKADTHIHSGYSDGGYGVSEIAQRATLYGCDVIAITDHGDRDLLAASAAYAEDVKVARRQFRNLTILAGLEWNVPPWDGEVHATLLVPPSSDEFLTLAEFKERFDGLGRSEADEELASEALEWLEERSSGGVAPVLMHNHPNRETSPAVSAERMRAWRSESELIVGFSGAPGHQRGEELGAYDDSTRLIDRWDPAVAEPGGAWDQLLLEGIDVWAARAPSDFHSDREGPRADFWPGQFSETWLYAPERSAEGALDAYRAGSFFAAHGHIVREAELTIDAAGLERPAHAGEAIAVPLGTRLKIQVAGKVPETDWSGFSNRIDVVELLITDPSGTRAEELFPTGSGNLEVSDALTAMEPGEVIVRARGRRLGGSAGDLLFYTNPVRVHVGPAAAAAGGTAGRDGTAESGWGLLIGLATVVLVVLGIAVWVWKQRGKPVATAAPPPRQERIAAGARGPRARHYAAGACAFLLIAIYGSLVPLHYTPMPWNDAVARFAELPWLDLDVGHRADWVANILLFIPISYCALGAFTVDRRFGWRHLALPIPIVLTCTAICVGIEFTQIFFPPRTTSQNDIAAETIGSIVGCLLWLGVGQRTTNWLRSRNLQFAGRTFADWLLQAYLAGLVIYAIMPLDLTIHPAELWHKYKDGRILLLPVWNVDFALDALWNRVLDVALLVPVGVWAARLRHRADDETGLRIRSLLWGVAVVAAIEIAQIFIYTRYAEATDILTGTVGVWIGVWMARRDASSSFGTGRALNGRQRMWHLAGWSVAVIAYSGLLCVIFWWPLEVEQDLNEIERGLESFWSVPFAKMYYGSEYHALTLIMRRLLYFAVLGVLCGQLMLVGAWRKRRLAIVLSLVFAFVLSSAIEFGQAYFANHYPDLTDVLLCTLGCWVGLLVRLKVRQSAEQSAQVPVARAPRLERSGTSAGLSRHTRAVWVAAGLLLLTAGGALAWWLSPSKNAERPTVETPKTFSELTGSRFTPVPETAQLAPAAREIEIPEFRGGYAIWGSTGRDMRGHIWFGVSSDGVDPPSAHLMELVPESGRVIDRGDVVSELKRAGVYQTGAGQAKIHSKIVQGGDGHLYFTSMDERGENAELKRLPRWGSHLWRYRFDAEGWEHLASAPEGLIALGGVGRWIYALGLWDHVLYQFDTEGPEGQTLKRVRVGSITGHISRNLLVDHHGHAYVPRLRAHGASASRSETRAADVELVEFNERLEEVGSTRLHDYQPSNRWRDHGIVGFCYLADRSIAFVTAAGRLYRIIPSLVDSAIVVDKGWIHPRGPSYTPSLFTYSGEKVLLGVSQRDRGGFDWVCYNLDTEESAAMPLAIEAAARGKWENLLLSGSVTRDDRGRFYVAGRSMIGWRKHPVLLQLTPIGLRLPHDKEEPQPDDLTQR